MVIAKKAKIITKADCQYSNLSCHQRVSISRTGQINGEQILKVVIRLITQEKNIKGIQIKVKEVKLSLFTETQRFCQKLLELISEFSKVA